ncbi:hypothetical protein HDU97_006940 [Phlyctochytrium planicorne]|nr:hypothetical protein HDU97_006940 [Phlyctochytrium planicorne]
MKAAVVLASLFAVANAHYILTTPRTRGFSDDDEAKGPCGSFDVAVNPVAFPLQSVVEIAAFHSKGNLTINIRAASATAFTKISTTAIEHNETGVCNPPPYFEKYSVDLTKIEGLTLKEGDNAVIQTVFDGPDGILYQCADVQIGSSKTLPARNDAGVSTVKDDDIAPIDLCTKGPDVIAQCKLTCNATTSLPSTVVGTQTVIAGPATSTTAAAAPSTTATKPSSGDKVRAALGMVVAAVAAVFAF